MVEFWNTPAGSSHTPALPFHAELRWDEDGGAVIIRATGGLGGRYSVETAGEVIAELPESGGVVELPTEKRGSGAEVIIIWQDKRGVMGARALLDGTPEAEVGPTWQRLTRPAGRIAEAVPITR